MNPLVIFQDIATFFKMVAAILRGQYKMPWQTFIWAFVCLVYLISPIDLLPDLLPALGFADDGAFVIFVLTLLHKDLVQFRELKNNSPKKDGIILDAEVIKNNSEEKESR